MSSPTAAAKAMLDKTRFIATAMSQSEVSNKTKGIMETQHNPNEPSKPTAPGQQGGRQQDREKQEREREQREREKSGGQQGGR